jgi:hypothetical protein
MAEVVSNFESEFEGEVSMWCVKDCVELGCTSLSAIESDGVVEYYCDVHGELADGFHGLTFMICNVHWPILGEDAGGL